MTVAGPPSSKPARGTYHRSVRPHVLVAVLCCCAACSPAEMLPTGAPPEVLAIDAERVALPDAANWPHRRAIDADLDGDGSAERLILAADVTLDASGRPLWEDGHRWALFVEDDGAGSLLYGAFVPNGAVEAAVLDAGANGARNVLVRERTPSQSRRFVIGYDARSARTVSAASDSVERWLPSLAAP